MTESTGIFVITHLLGVSSSVFLSGFAFSASYLGIPALSVSPITLRLKQWQVIYDLGKLVSPTVAAASSGIWGYTAWVSHSYPSNSDWKLYTVAGLATFAILPFTAVVMMPVNNELMRRAKVAEEVESERLRFETESEALLGKWNWMNCVRALLPMVGAWVGLYTALR